MGKKILEEINVGLHPIISVYCDDVLHSSDGALCVSICTDSSGPTESSRICPSRYVWTAAAQGRRHGGHQRLSGEFLV